MLADAQKWGVCDVFGVTMHTLEQVQAHHHPNHRGTAALAMESKAGRA